MKRRFFRGMIVALCFFLSACSAVSSAAPEGAAESFYTTLSEEQKQRIEDALQSIPDTSAPSWVNEEPSVSSIGMNYSEARLADTKEDAAQIMMAILKDAPYPYDYIIRDSISMNGKEIPCIWIFAVNELGESIDLLFYDIEYASSDMDPVVIRNDPVFIWTRKNECTNFVHGFHYPSNILGIGQMIHCESKNHLFGISFTGQTFSMLDLRIVIYAEEENETDWDHEFEYWNGSKWVTITQRPEQSAPFSSDQVNYPTHKPEENLKKELESMLTSLETSGEGYNWEFQNDEITLEGNTYPVVWVFAENQKGEWVDILFSEDPDFCYLMTRHQEEIGLQRKTQPESLDRTFEDWLTQDVFYHGYSFYMDGDAHAIRDCGMAWGMK